MVPEQLSILERARPGCGRHGNAGRSWNSVALPAFAADIVNLRTDCFLLRPMGTVYVGITSPERNEEQTLMAAIPFRRKPSKTERYLGFAAPAVDRAKNGANAVAKQASRLNGKVVAAVGAGAGLAAAGAAAFRKRDKITGVLPGRSEESAPPAPVPAPPQPSNYDAPGPVANTATPIPAPDSQDRPTAIDESAEEAAAAAEAGAIGGEPSSYAGSEPGEPADEAERPLAEAGQGEAEGQEQAEAALADNATTRGTGMTDAERQIEDTIEQAGQPQSGETPEPLAATSGDQQPDAQDAVVPPTDAEQETAGGGISGRPYAGLEHKDETDEDTAESPATPTDAEQTDETPAALTDADRTDEPPAAPTDAEQTDETPPATSKTAKRDGDSST